MGFYDDFDTKPKRKGNGGTWIAVALVSALIGSGTTVALVPALIKNNVIDVNGSVSNTAMASTTGSSTNGLAPKQMVNVDVQSGIVEAVNKVKPAVVGISNMQQGTDFFGRQTQEQEAGTGSGVLFDTSKGYIVTNNHVVEGAKDLEVTLEDGKRVKAELVGTDPLTDLAVVKVDPAEVKSITAAVFGSSENLNIGEPAIAIGNPLGLKFAQTVTTGVISATKREMPTADGAFSMSVLQTDAAINPGNSGGALVNIKGEVIGINSAKISQTGIEGIGFAIPMDEAKPIIQQLIEKGKVERPVLGISPVDLADVDQQRLDVPVETGVVIAKVSGNAEKAGLERGDVIVKIDEDKVDDQIALRKALYKKQPGDSVKVEYYRGKELKTVEVKLGAQ
jgi:serine protease Do